MAKEIKLTQGRVAIVDDHNYDWLNQWRWSFSGYKKRKHGYAIRRIYPNGRYKKGVTILMHRLIMNCPQDKQVDHIDRNTTNNTEANLRLCTQQQNCLNAKMHRNNKSGFVGVYWHVQNKKWCAHITRNGKKMFLGQFKNKVSAAKAYDRIAKKFDGEFVRGNFI